MAEPAPFRVKQSSFAGEWCLFQQSPNGRLGRMYGWFDTPAEAIDYAYRNWPRWP